MKNVKRMKRNREGIRKGVVVGGGGWGRWRRCGEGISPEISKNEARSDMFPRW